MSEINNTLAELKTASQAVSAARTRLTYLFDDGKFTELDAYAKDGGELTGVITAFGYAEGNPVYAFSQNIDVKNGAVSKASADKIVKIYDLAAKTGVPVIGIYDSCGADVSDQTKALKAYGELLLWASNLSGVVPQIAVVAGVCAGCAAMLAQSADFVVMAKDAQMYVAPNCDIKDHAENAAANGTASLICEDDKAAVEAAREILLKLPQNNLSPVPMYEFSEPDAAFSGNAAADSEAVFDAGSVMELNAGCGKASYTALASLGGATVGIVATNKTNDKLDSADCSKIARFVRTCDGFGVPVITFVDTEGFKADDASEMQGAVKSMAKLAHAYSEATTIKLSVVTGKAYGPAYIALAGKGASSDLSYATPSAVISALDPVTAVEFLEHDKLKGADDLTAARNSLAKDYVQSNANAATAAAEGCVDGIIEPSEIRQTLIDSIEIMAGKRISRLPKKHSNIQL